MEITALKIGVTIISIAGLAFGKRRVNGAVCPIAKDLSQKTVIITGATSGIGKETARSLAKMKANVVLACRDPTKAIDTVKALQQESNNLNVEYMHLDLADLRSIKDFTRQFQVKHKKLDILINNAGVINFQTRLQTKDKFENQFGVNYLGHYYLTNKLLGTLKNTPSSRIINVTCSAYSSGKINWEDLMSVNKYSPYKAYSQSKLALVLFTRELNKRLEKEKANVKTVAVHPGIVRTDLHRDMPRAWYLDILKFVQTPFWYYFTKTSFYGAQNVVYYSVEDYEKLEGGNLYSKYRKQKLTPNAMSEEDAERLWKKSAELLLEKKFVL